MRPAPYPNRAKHHNVSSPYGNSQTPSRARFGVGSVFGRALVCAAIVGTILVASTPVIVSAVTEEEIAKAEEQQVELERLAKEEEALRDAAMAREGALQQQLAIIERQRYTAVEQLREVKRELDTVSLAVFDITASIERLNRALARETSNLAARVRSLYKAGRTSMLETVLSSSSFSEALERATSLERALAQDLAEIATLRQSRRTVELRTVDLTARLDRMEELRVEAETIESELRRRSEEQQDLIFGQQREQATLQENMDAFNAEAVVVGNRIAVLRDIRKRELEQLEKLERLRKQREEALRIAEEERRKSEAARNEAQNNAPQTPPVPVNVPLAGDTYVWPLFGYITTEFGGCTFGQCPHVGMDIAADFLSPVVAANRGVVLQAGLVVPGNPSASYGMIVVIAHSLNEETLYAHLDDTTAPPPVQPGQIVEAGQVIGFIGLTGWTTGPHLHFEHRVNGVAVNPRNVLGW